ncbi:hypothetical protein FRC01_004022 [Tulasnella sp. 417]|nr:hypothetical protein FRC01_004022 [Tulasnella sp. 417]
MENSPKLTKPPESIIDSISNILLMAVAEANQGDLRLKWLVLNEGTGWSTTLNNFYSSSKSLGDPDLSDSTQVSEQIKALELAQVVIKQSLDRRIAGAGRQRNTLQPVNKLPPEVLSAIFHQVLAMVSIFDHFTSLFNLAKVSARWRSVIDSTPSLWSYVSSTYPNAGVERALKKSASLPVSVAYRSREPELTATTKRGSRDLLRTIKSSGRSWDELILHLPTVGHLKRFLERPSPHLRKLDIEAYGVSDTTVNIFGGKQGGLEDVRLIRPTIEWKSEALTGLRRLELGCSMGGFSSLTLTEIVWLLERNPGLQYFSWSGGYRIDEFVPPDTISLPHLTELSLNELKEPILLNLIHAPSCRRFTLRFNSYQEGGHLSLLSPLQRLLPCFRNSLQQSTALSICLSEFSFHYHCVPLSPDSGMLDFKFDNKQLYPMLEWVSQELHGININTPPIHIHFKPRFDFTRDMTLPALFRLRNVVNVKLAESLVEPVWLLRGLSKPNGAQGEFWPFPELAELEMTLSSLRVQDVLDFIRSRYVDELPQGAPKRPPMLKTLRLIGYKLIEPEAEQELERILPPKVYSLEDPVWIVQKPEYDWGEEDDFEGRSVVASQPTDTEQSDAE